MLPLKNSPAPEATATTGPTGAALRPVDRCDAACGAQAFVRTASGERVLDFCAHHYAEHKPELIAAGWSPILDNRHLINTKPGGSA